MILQPRKSKFKKAQKGTINPYLMYNRFHSIHSNSLYLIACESRRLSSVQIEAARIAINRKVRQSGYHFQIRVFPNVPVTKKPNEVRMGQGKGPVVRWICRIKPNQIIFKTPNHSIFRIGLKSRSFKLPFNTIITN